MCIFSSHNVYFNNSHQIERQREGTFVPVHNYAPRREAVWGSGGTASHILNPGTRWWVTSFMLRSLYSQGKNPGTQQIGWAGSSLCGRRGLENNLSPLPRIKPHPPVSQPVARSLSWLSYGGFLIKYKTNTILWNMSIYNTQCPVSFFLFVNVILVNYPFDLLHAEMGLVKATNSVNTSKYTFKTCI
jgi:hypothetical protein